jgi:RHS repeat-associated protein
MNFEDGRIRVISPTSQNNGFDVLAVDGNIDLPGGKRGAYDYFIMDYLQNVRMILTEETHVASNKATMESSRSTLEESIFGQAGSNNEVATTRYTKPSGWTGNSSSQLSRIGTNSGHNIGPNALQKVMAGDKITATVLYYHEGSPGGNNTNFVNALIGSLSPVITGSSGATNAVKTNASNITSQLGNVNGFINSVQPNGSNPSSATPQAFLTILFFDERFNFIEAADGGAYQQQVASSVGSNGASLTLVDKKAPKNGYVYIYVSNQSNNHVYFDDFNVAITQGNIVEENHYYSYGLKISAISSRKFADSYEGLTKNNYLYNGKEFFDDADLNWYDYGFRNYDPQIGRFPQLDPLTDIYPVLTPYQYASCDPINNIDFDGLEGCVATQGMCGFVGNMVKTTSQASKIAGTFSRVLSGVSAATHIWNSTNYIIKTNSNKNLNNQIAASNKLNNYFESMPVGSSPLLLKRQKLSSQPRLNAKNRINSYNKSKSEFSYTYQPTVRDPRSIIAAAATVTIFGLIYTSIVSGNENSFSSYPDHSLPDNTYVSSSIIIEKTFFDAYAFFEENMPPYPKDIHEPPAEGWEWRGKNKKPGSKEGSWHNPDTGEVLYPNLDHPPGIDPHWDYRAPDGDWYWWFPNGKLVPKKPK